MVLLYTASFGYGSIHIAYVFWDVNQSTRFCFLCMCRESQRAHCSPSLFLKLSFRQSFSLFPYVSIFATDSFFFTVSLTSPPAQSIFSLALSPTTFTLFSSPLCPSQQLLSQALIDGVMERREWDLKSGIGHREHSCSYLKKSVIQQ